MNFAPFVALSIRRELNILGPPALLTLALLRRSDRAEVSRPSGRGCSLCRVEIWEPNSKKGDESLRGEVKTASEQTTKRERY